MVRPITNHVGESFSAIPLAIGLFVSVSLLVSLCAKHARQIPRNRMPKTSEPNTPKHKSHKQEGDTGILGYKDKGQEEESGLWQKAILMGEKCRPPQFPGVIYYDCTGNRIPEMPRSPRACSPIMSPLRDFANFPVEKIDTSQCTNAK